MSTFASSVVVITGGGSGIGAALGREAASRGARVALADIRFESAQRVAAEIGNAAKAYHVDVANAASIGTLAADVQRDLGDTNLLFANAGVIVAGGLPETSLQDFEWMFDVNVLGLYRTIRVFLPSILASAKQGRSAHIIATGSENSVGLPLTGPTTAYTATKHAVVGLCDGLRRDLKDQGVSVSILCPGIVVTNLADARGTRHERYGGALDLPPEELETILEFMRAHGRLPADTARLCCEAVDRGDFFIMADPGIRGLVQTRNREIEAALDILDRQLASGTLTSAR